MNSLHNQGIDQLAPGLIAEGIAPDGTIEAVRVVSCQAGPAVGYAVGVQWHPEYDWRTDALSRAIFEQFGTAVRAYADAARLGGVCPSLRIEGKTGALPLYLASGPPSNLEISKHFSVGFCQNSF